MSNIDNYCFYEEDSLYKQDRNRCTVVTLATCTGMTYLEAFQHMEKFGRKNKEGMFKDEIQKALSNLKGFYAKKGEYSNTNRITINNFLNKHPKGTYYCGSRGHSFCIKDGALYDHSEKLRRQITLAYRIYTTEEINKIKQQKIS